MPNESDSTPPVWQTRPLDPASIEIDDNHTVTLSAGVYHLTWMNGKWRITRVSNIPTAPADPSRLADGS